MARIAKLFDLDQHHFEHQPRMRIDAREVDQLVEHVEARFPAWGCGAATRPGRRRDFCFTRYLQATIGLTIRTRCSLHERRDLVADGRERAELDLDQLVAVDDVDPVAADPLLELRAVRRVVGFELSVQRGFHTSGASGF